MKLHLDLAVGETGDIDRTNKEQTETLAQRVKELMRIEQLDEKTALKQAAKEFGLSKSEAYRELQRKN